MVLAAWLLSLFLPWWSVFIPGLILGALLGRTGGYSFLWGFVGIGALWLIQILFVHIDNDGVLTTRIADLFSLPSGWFVIFITVIIGGLIGGLTTLTGYLLRKVFSDQPHAEVR